MQGTCLVGSIPTFSTNYLTAHINAVIMYAMVNTIMRTKYCPHCCSEKIHRVEEADGSHFHECEECDETWSHHESTQNVAEKSNN